MRGKFETPFGEDSQVRAIIPDPQNEGSNIYRDTPDPWLDRQQSHYEQFCQWSDANGFNPVEFLLPQIQMATDISLFSFEKRFAEEGRIPPTAEQLELFAPWHYTLDFGEVSTRALKLPMEWHFHRYRSSMLLGLAAEIAGPERSRLSVLDVACHCGVFSLEFAERGFGSVRGLDLRPENIEQAKFLAKTYGISNVSFSCANARDLASVAPADILFCGGLVYHVTFPMELFENIFALTGEFAIIDTLAQKHPFSGFHLVCGKDADRSLEGETHYEFMPTYRALVDALQAVGFRQVYEVLGDRAAEIPVYQDHNVRSFLAVKNPDGVFKDFGAAMKRSVGAPAVRPRFSLSNLIAGRGHRRT